MAATTEELLDEILGSLDRIEYVKPEDVPNIDLYMDQVLTFLDSKLKSVVRQQEDRPLTKTMINNYAKNDLLPPPVKKKYSKEHVLLLIFIYYYKGVIPMNEIQTLLAPITERYFTGDQELNLESIYREVFRMEKGQIALLKEDVKEKFQESAKTFPDAAAKEQEFLQKFSLICLLSFDVYLKKLIIEKLVDDVELLENERKADSGQEETKKKSEK